MADLPVSGHLSVSERRLRWFIVGWITLSTILNLIDRNTLAILAPTFSSVFSGGSFRNPSGLVEKLRSPSGPISQYVRNQFSVQSQQVLMDPNSTPKQQQAILIQELNKIVGSPLFSAISFTSASRLAARLRFSSDPISNYLWNRFPVGSQKVLMAPGSTSQTRQAVLVKELNEILRGNSIYDAQRFGAVTLSPEALKLQSQNPRGEDLIRLNRWLLEDAYPQEMAKNQNLRGNSIYDAQRFAGVTLSKKTLELLSQNPQGKGLIRLNRLLLEDAYPQEIMTSPFEVTEQNYANIVNAFLLAYTIMYTVGGRFVDWAGERIGMMACILWWSIATMLHSLARGVLSLGVFRFLLGIGEPGNYPAALRVCTTWFAKAERGLPIAIFSSGSSVGSLLAVPSISFLTLYFGWRAAFFVPGFIGLIWVLVWVLAYRMPSVALDGPAIPVESLTQAETPPRARESLLDLLKDGRVRAIVLARFVSDPVWVFYLYWTPKYFASEWGFNLKDIGLYVWIPFLFGGLGGVFGGVASDWLIRRGLEPAQARKRLLYIAGAVAPLGMATGFAGSAGVSLVLIAVMAFVVYIWYIDTAALISDVFPERVVGSILGLMGTAGSFGGMGLNWLAGYVLAHYHSYTPIFLVAGSGHLLASLILFSFMKEKGNLADSR